MTARSLLVAAILFVGVLYGCAPGESGESATQSEKASDAADVREYFYLRPEVEKAYGYTHAVKVGNDIKISGAVSMDDAGNPTAIGDLEQQMKNAYSDLDQVLRHYGLSFDDVIVENIFTTDMARFLEVAAFRSSIYTDQFPTGSWLEVKGLALPEFMIEIELEAHSEK
jgi:enamine deaminase RidA (YjgF/YER057c/UK114 family)